MTKTKQTVAVAFIAGREVSKKWRGKASDGVVREWLYSRELRTANVHVTDGLGGYSQHLVQAEYDDVGGISLPKNR